MIKEKIIACVLSMITMSVMVWTIRQLFRHLRYRAKLELLVSRRYVYMTRNIESDKAALPLPHKTEDFETIEREMRVLFNTISKGKETA